MAEKKTEKKPVMPEDAMKEALAEIDAEKAAPLSEAEEPADLSAEEQEALEAEIVKKQEELNRLLRQKTAYFGGRYHRSSEEQYRETMSAEHIRTEFEDAKVENEQTERKEDWNLISASKASGAILTGTVIGLHNPGSGENTTPCAKIRFGNAAFKIYIPFYVLLPNQDMRKYADNDSRMAIEKEIMRMVGAKIKFVIRDVDMKTSVCIGDRLQAMHKDFYENWVRPSSKDDKKPWVTPGMLVQTQVIGVTRQTVTLSYYGCDQTLAIRSKEVNNEVSWEYVQDLKQIYKVGQFVNAKVLAVESYEKKVGPNSYTLGRASFSIKQATRNPIEKYWDDYNEGDIVQATVTGMNETSFFVRLEGKCQAMCARPRNGSRQPEIGDEGCLVRITEKQMDPDGSRKRIYGVFTSY